LVLFFLHLILTTLNLKGCINIMEQQLETVEPSSMTFLMCYIKDKRKSVNNVL